MCSNCKFCAHFYLNSCCIIARAKLAPNSQKQYINLTRPTHNIQTTYTTENPPPHTYALIHKDLCLTYALILN